MTGQRRAELMAVVDAAQRVAGILAARERGDGEGAADLFASFESERSLVEGALLLSELSLRLYGAQSGLSVDQAVRELCLQMESAVERLDEEDSG